MSFFRENRLRLVEFNVENLFVLMDHYDGRDLASIDEKQWQRFSSSTTSNKPLKHARGIARAIRDLDADIVMLCEVGGIESLRNFSKYFLDDAYAPFLIEGNSDRGIDIGYLAKKSLPFTYDLFSHKNRSIDFLYPHERLTRETGYTHLRAGRVKSHRFSRDVLELRIFEDSTAGTAENPDELPVLIILLVHLKSQLDSDGIDPGGRDRRKAELEKLVEIYHEINDDFGNKVPIILTGDFNGVAVKDKVEREFEAIYRRTDLHDCLEIAGIPHDERFTYQHMVGHRHRNETQLDYIFLPPSLAARVDRDHTWVYRYRDDNGTHILLPRNLEEKRLLPSDHFPVVLTLNSENVPTSR